MATKDFRPRPWKVVGTPDGLCVEDANQNEVIPPNPRLVHFVAELICDLAEERDALLQAARGILAAPYTPAATVETLRPLVEKADEGLSDQA